ncbi:MAG TPA: FumA C-terminus/TtdB family hydratase beta subunit [bacterium]|nr:FumA C-terminus/TtdB family hydratase beta subunit [bacterium]
MSDQILVTPLAPADIERLRAGDEVLLSGVVYTARDAAHERLARIIAAGQAMPVDLRGQVLYYCGPTPARPGRPIGSAGPTTASRMDPYTPALLERGVRGMIGKGRRSAAVRDAIRRYGAVYLAAVEGTAALLGRRVRSAEVVAFPDLGAEAIYRLVVEQFPLVVANDCRGGDVYEDGRAKFRR